MILDNLLQAVFIGTPSPHPKIALNGSKLIFKGIQRASHLPDVFTNFTNGSKEKGNKCFIFDKQLTCLVSKKVSKYDQKVIRQIHDKYRLDKILYS